MDPDDWGPYGWKMIHAFSRLPVTLGAYRSWLEATVGVLPCRKCRKNFKRHLQGTACKHPDTPATLSICLHEEVSRDLGKTSPNARPGVWKPADLPAPTRGNLIQPMFWMTLAANTMERKNGVIEQWLEATVEILEKGSQEELGRKVKEFQGDLLKEGGALTLHQNSARRRRMAEQLREFFHTMGVTAPTQTDLRERFDKIPPSSLRRRPRATRKREHTERRSSRSTIKRRESTTRS